MLEDLPLPWMYDRFNLMNTSNFKRKTEEDDKLGNSLKLFKINNAENMEVGFLNLSLSLGVNPSNDDAESSSRNPQMGENDAESSSHNPQMGDNAGDGDGSETIFIFSEMAENAEDGSETIPFIPEMAVIVWNGPEGENIWAAENVGDGPEAIAQMAENVGDGNESSSLIPQMGEDNSINCIAHCSRSDYGSIAQLNRSFRALVGGKEIYKLRRQLGIVEHWIYFSCNLREWEVFDPIRLRWKHLPVMPCNECFMTSDKESIAVGTDLLVFGKSITSHIIYKYSLLTNSWTTAGEMNTPRCLFGSATLGEIAILAGGCDVWGNMFSSAELYNADTETWELLPSMNKPRKKSSAVFMDGKFYVIGGLGVGHQNFLTCGEVYDLEKRTWTEIQDMLPLRDDPSASTAAPPLLTVVNNELYAADYAQKDVRKYNKSSNSWSSVGILPEKARSMNGWGLAFRGCGDKLIVLGGPRSMDGGYVEVNAWTPSESPQQWTVLGRNRSGGFVYNCAIMGC